jgi:hypothetical protein
VAKTWLLENEPSIGAHEQAMLAETQLGDNNLLQRNGGMATIQVKILVGQLNAFADRQFLIRLGKFFRPLIILSYCRIVDM